MQNWCDVQFLPSELSSELFEVLCIKFCVLLFSMSFIFAAATAAAESWMPEDGPVAEVSVPGGPVNK